MRYELYLRSPVDDKAWPEQELLQVLEAAGFAVQSGLPAGLPDMDLKAEAFRREGAEEPGPCQGLNFSFPLGVTEAQAARALDRVFDVSEANGAQIFDPQLGRLCSRKDHGQVSASWRRSYQFHSGIAGTPDLGTGAPELGASGEDDGWMSKYKPMLIGGLIILVGVFLFRSCLSNWLEKAMVAPPPVDSRQGGP